MNELRDILRRSLRAPRAERGRRTGKPIGSHSVRSSPLKVKHWPNNIHADAISEMIGGETAEKRIDASFGGRIGDHVLAPVGIGR